MGLLTKLLDWVERTARYWRGGETGSGQDHPRLPGAVRRGRGEYVIGGGLMGGAATGYAGGWTQDRLEQVLHYRHWTYIAVRAITHQIAGLPPMVAHVRPGPAAPSTRVRGQQLLGQQPLYLKSMRAVQEHEQVDPVGPEHPLRRLLTEPNAWDVAADWISELVMFLELTGNGYLWLVPNGFGLPCELWVMPSHWVWPRLGPAGVAYYEIRPFLGTGTLRFPPEEIIHLRYKSPAHKIDGWGPQQAGAEWIDAGESVNTSRFWQFKNGCYPIGNLELGEGYADPDDAELERIYAKFFARVQGEQNHGVPIITPPGAKYNPLTISPAEMAYVQSADQLRDWVLALYGVPKEVAGIQDAGSEIAMYGPLVQFSQFTIAPKLRYLGQALTRWLARRYDPTLRIWWEDPTPESPDQLNRNLDLDARHGQISSAEYRAARNRPPYTPEEEERYSTIGKTTGPAAPGESPGGPPGAAAATPTKGAAPPGMPAPGASSRIPTTVNRRYAA